MFSDKEELMLGSYPPSSTPHTFEFPQWEYQEAPSGMLYRGRYKVKNSYFQGAEKDPFAGTTLTFIEIRLPTYNFLTVIYSATFNYIHPFLYQITKRV